MNHHTTHAPAPRNDLPHALTFFLTRAERRAVLRALREHDADRRTALLRALAIDEAKEHQRAR